MGRFSLKKQLQRHVEQTNIWPWVNEHLGNVNSMKEGLDALSTATNGAVKSTLPPFRSLIAGGVKGGRIKKGSGLLYIMTHEQRGRPRKNVESVETETETETATV